MDFTLKIFSSLPQKVEQITTRKTLAPSSARIKCQARLEPKGSQSCSRCAANFSDVGRWHLSWCPKQHLSHTCNPIKILRSYPPPPCKRFNEGTQAWPSRTSPHLMRAKQLPIIQRGLLTGTQLKPVLRHDSLNSSQAFVSYSLFRKTSGIKNKCLNLCIVI